MRRMLPFIAVLIPTIAFAQISPFLDVVGHPHAAQVEFLHSRGIVQGYGYGIFRPDINLNRAEFLKILMLGVFGNQVISVDDNKCFADFKGTEQWYWAYACFAKEKGFIDGYPDGTFRGSNKVNLAEALKMSIDAWEMRKPVYPDGPPNWYDPYFDVGASRRIFDSFPYNPKHLLTRSEVAVLLVALGQRIQTVEFSPQSSPNVVDTITTGDDIIFSDDDEDLSWDIPNDDIDLNIPNDVSDWDIPDDDMNWNIPDNNLDDDVSPSLSQCGNGILEETEECDDGNILDGDGCSSICIIVPIPIRHAVLKIEERPIDESVITAGANDVLLFAFDAIAGRQDIFLTGITFTSNEGTLSDAQNFRVFVDMNDDGIAETFVGNSSSQGEKLTFSNLNISIAKNESRRIELVADISIDVNPSSLSVGFDTTNSQYITAIGIDDGRELIGIETDSGGCSLSICWIAVFTLSSRNTITVNNQGNLYIMSDSIPVRSHQIKAGELSEPLFHLKLRASGENIEVTDITFAGGNDYIDQLEIYEEGKSDIIGIAKPITCDTVTFGLFCAKLSFIVPRDTTKSLLVRAFIRPDSPADASGNSFSIYLTSGTSPQPAVKARGKDSNNILNQNNGNRIEEGEIFIGTDTPSLNMTITSPTHDIVASNIISIVNANDEPDGTSIPIGNVVFAVFRFRASNKISSESFPVNIRDLTISVLADGVQIDPSSIIIFNKLNPNSTKGCNANATTGNIVVQCSNLENSVVKTEILQGSTIELALKANIAKSQINSGISTLQASLRNLGDRSSSGTIEWDDGSTTFNWVDIEEQKVESTLYEN